jgi:hypothetical protein
MPDEIVVDTDKATATYDEKTDWDGRNRISRATGSQWDHETLYRSAKGRWYLVHTSQRTGTMPRAEWVKPGQAAAWLIHNDHDIPPELEDVAAEVTE